MHIEFDDRKPEGLPLCVAAMQFDAKTDFQNVTDIEISTRVSSVARQFDAHKRFYLSF